MKKLVVFAVLLGGLVIFAAPSAMAADAKKPEGFEARVSYALGLNIGRGFQAQGIPVKTDVFLQGMEDGLKSATPLLTDEEMQAAMQQLRAEIQKKQQARSAELGEKNLQESQAFFAANKDKKGVETLPSGLQYKMEKAGTGKSPGETDTVTVHYKGTLLNGQVFDSSYKRGKPATFKLNGVIPGWTEGLQLLKEGGKCRLFIPPELGYGARGAGQAIPPNAGLIFDVELIKVN